MVFFQACGRNMERNKPYLVMIFIQFVYAGMSLMSKAAITEGMNPYVFVVCRQALATLALAPFALYLERNKDSPPLSLPLLGKIFAISTGITLSLNLFYFALNYVSATFATALTNTIPVITFILAVCFRMESLNLKQRQGMVKVVGSTLGLLGALLCTFARGPAMYSEREKDILHLSKQTYTKHGWIKGSLVILAANVSWSSWLIMQGHLIKQYPTKLRLTALQCFFSCISSAIWAAAKERNVEAWKLGWNVNLLSVLYCGLIVTAISYWLQVWVVEKKGPVFTAVFSPLALIITAIFSAVLFQETLHWGSVLGAILLVIGLYGILWAKSEEGKTEADNKDSKIEENKRKQENENETVKSEVASIVTPLALQNICGFDRRRTFRDPWLVSNFRTTVSLNVSYIGLNFVSATFLAALGNTVPVITFVIAVCLRMERLNIRQRHGMVKVIGSVLGLSGALLSTFARGPAMYPESQKNIFHLPKQTYTRDGWIKGSLIIIAANVVWCLWLAAQGPLIKQYPAKLRLTALQCLFSSVTSAVWAVAMERNPESWKFGWNLNLFTVLYSGVLMAGFGYWLIAWVVEKKGPLFTAVYMPLSLVIAAIFSAIFFQETIHWGSYCYFINLWFSFMVGLKFLWNDSAGGSPANSMASLQGCVRNMERNKPYLFMILSQFLGAGTSLLSKASINEGMNPYVFVVHRQAFAALALAPFAFFMERNKQWPPLSASLLCKILVVSTGTTVNLNLAYYAYNYISATFVTALVNTIPAITFVLAVCFRMESLNIRQRHGMVKAIGSALGLLGALLCTFTRGPAVYHESQKDVLHLSKQTYTNGGWIKGSLIMMTANVVWCLWLIAQASLVKLYPAKFRLTALQSLFSCITSTIWAVAMERNPESWKLGWNLNLLAVFYCVRGVIVAGLCYWLLAWAVEKKGPVFTAVFSPLSLLITAIFSAIFFQETLHWGSVCGAIILVIGLYGILWAKSREDKPEATENHKGESEEIKGTDIEYTSTRE
ncbi:uncharacterized protein LOC127246574 [Andrographis paniculata]|uniref:uncharacterized protein LOC127246574 n=1 Tax=Andrographis paniculata TaxID=175694 RepID=UPI0021E80F92|nr:uncharacterized protein LOC127246574 [Andrographis paniculata]